MTEEKNNNQEVKTEARSNDTVGQAKADLSTDVGVSSAGSPAVSGGSGKEAVVEKTAIAPAAPSAPSKQPQRGGDRRGGGMRDKNVRGPRKGRGRSRRGFGERVKPEFDQKVIDIRRVTRVVSGGRRFSFSVALVAGNRKGSVGVGVGKSSDTSSAIEKASRNAKKNMIKVKLDKNMSIPHEVETKFASTRVALRPAPGKGLVAGSSVRNVLDLAGVKNVSSKLISRSKNKLNNARAAIEALKQFK